MAEILSAQVVSIAAYAGLEHGPLLRPDAGVVKREAAGVKASQVGTRAERDLLWPAFEAKQSGPRLWLRRWLWRQQLRAAFRYEADGVLEDFGLSRDQLDHYLARPFWQP